MARGFVMHLYRALGFVAPFKPFSAEKHAYILLLFWIQMLHNTYTFFFLKRLTKHVCVCYVELWHLVFLLFCRLESENHTRVIMKPAAKERRPCVWGGWQAYRAKFFDCGAQGDILHTFFFGQPTYVYENVSIYNVCCLWALSSLFSKIKKYINRFFSK